MASNQQVTKSKWYSKQAACETHAHLQDRAGGKACGDVLLVPRCSRLPHTSRTARAEGKMRLWMAGACLAVWQRVWSWEQTGSRPQLHLFILVETCPPLEDPPPSSCKQTPAPLHLSGNTKGSKVGQEIWLQGSCSRVTSLFFHFSFFFFFFFFL